MFWVTLYQIPSIHVDWSKIMATRGWGCFALYGYSENSKNLLHQKYLACFHTFEKMFFA